MKFIFSILTFVLAGFLSANIVFAGEATGSIGTAGVGGNVPSAPTNFTATVQGTTQIDLLWSAVSGVDGYELYKSDSLLTTTSDISYTNIDLTAGTAYSYKIRSYLGSVKSDFSAVVSATTEVEPAPNPASSGGGGSGGGGGGGGSSTPAPSSNDTTTTTDTATVDSGDILGIKISEDDSSGEVLGVKILDSREQQIVDITNEVGTLLVSDKNSFVQAVNKTIDESLEISIATDYTLPLTSDITLSASEKTIINDFIAYGTPTTDVLGAGERTGVLNSYKSAFGKLPTTQTEWEDIVKIANGRWPTERNAVAEADASTRFTSIYLRAPDMDNPNDNAAVTIMSYGLRPSNRNLDSEKAGIITFRAIFGVDPVTAIEWDSVRAIAYSGSIR